MVTWNKEADAKLLIGILELCKPKIDYDALAKWMGDDVTVSSVSDRIRRIKEDFKNVSGIAASEDSSPRKPVAKAKRGRGAGKADAKSNGERASKKTKVEKDGVDDGEASTA
ncbi:hypothetical protein PHISCL_07727 [Aspergillus sclerotialis]|uniref:Uncharacterized protein n=1 Tax=Aspergillus sclerotialis TaxID=2070753 RepID=A0A3A2ZKN4_9EURO|nr:hypothetical protein PHISCL_07727 [Aspergillus sclerotialis]